MQYQNVSATRPAESVGEIIDRGYALQLIRGFKEQFPGEMAEILIETKTIFKSIGNLSNISGVRFMYGMERAGDPASKLILLIPCNTSGEGSLPNAIVQPEGYLDHRGERVGLKRSWVLLYNHAIHYSGFFPEIKFSKIFRGDFFGIDSLTSLLMKNRKAHSVMYHFGFDADIADLPLRHKPVLNPLSADGTSYDVYLDLSALCPPMCGDPNDPPSCVVTDMVNGNAHVNVQQKELNIYRIYRDSYFLRDPDNGPLVEMYYYVSPALTEAIISTGRSKEIYAELYHNQVRQCNQFIKRGRYEAAKELFERTMEYLMKEYLFRENA